MVLAGLAVTSSEPDRTQSRHSPVHPTGQHCHRPPGLVEVAVTSMIPIPEVVQRRHRVVIGVDTHKYVHVAVALDEFGGVIDAQRFAADRAGYTLLIDWAAGLGRKLTVAIEGTGSSGAGLTAAVRRRAIGVIEVLRIDRRDRRLRGTNDTLDAENAARAVLGGQATAVPKTNDGVVEMLRQIKVATDVAVKARTAAMISLTAVLVNAHRNCARRCSRWRRWP